MGWPEAATAIDAFVCPSASLVTRTGRQVQTGRLFAVRGRLRPWAARS